MNMTKKVVIAVLVLTLLSGGLMLITASRREANQVIEQAQVGCRSATTAISALQIANLEWYKTVIIRPVKERIDSSREQLASAKEKVADAQAAGSSKNRMALASQAKILAENSVTTAEDALAQLAELELFTDSVRAEFDSFKSDLDRVMGVCDAGRERFKLESSRYLAKYQRENEAIVNHGDSALAEAVIIYGQALQSLPAKNNSASAGDPKTAQILLAQAKVKVGEAESDFWLVCLNLDVYNLAAQEAKDALAQAQTDINDAEKMIKDTEAKLGRDKTFKLGAAIKKLDGAKRLKAEADAAFKVLVEPERKYDMPLAYHKAMKATEAASLATLAAFSQLAQRE